MRAAIICVAAGAFVEGDWPAALKALLVLPPAFLGRLVAVAPLFDLAFVLALVAEVVGTTFGIYDSIGWSDNLFHFVLSLLCAPILYGALLRLGAVVPITAKPNPGLVIGSALITAAAVFALGAAWELVEWAADSWLGTNYSLGYQDTLTDLLADGAAAAAGGVLAVRSSP